MDNASESVPQTTDTTIPEQQPANAAQSDVQATPDTYHPEVQTITEDTILSSPTPIDRDPPPLQDVPPPINQHKATPAPVPLSPEPAPIEEPIILEADSTPIASNLPELTDDLPLEPLPVPLVGEVAPSESPMLEQLPEQAPDEIAPVELETAEEVPQTAADPNLLPSLLLAPDVSSTNQDETEDLIEPLPLEAEESPEEVIEEVEEAQVETEELPLVSELPEDDLSELVDEVSTEQLPLETELLEEIDDNLESEELVEEVEEPADDLEELNIDDLKEAEVDSQEEEVEVIKLVENEPAVAKQLEPTKSDGYVKNEFFVSEGAEDPWILPVGAKGKSSSNKKVEAKQAKKRGVWGWVTNAFFAVGILLLIGLVVLWLARGLIAEKVEANIAQKIEEAGLYIDYDEWKYDAVRGLVLQNLTIYENEDRAIPYAKIDNVGLNTDLLALIKSRDPVASKSSISFRESAVQLYDKAELVANLQNVRGSVDLDLPNHYVELNNLRGILESTQFSVEGDIYLPQTAEQLDAGNQVMPVATANSSDGAVAKSKAVLPSLAVVRKFTPYFRFNTAGSLPSISSNLSIDLAETEPKIKADGRFSGMALTLKETLLAGIEFDQLELPFVYDNSIDRIDLNGLKVRYGNGNGGQLTGDINYAIGSKNLGLNNVRSTLNIVKLLTEIDPAITQKISNLTFLDSPEIYVSSGQVPIETPLNGQLDFSYKQWAGMLIDLSGKSLPVSEIRGNFKLARSVLHIPSLNAKVMDGPSHIVGNLRLGKGSYPFNGAINVQGMPMESVGRFAGIDSQLMKGLLDLKFQGTVSNKISLLNGSGSVDLKNSQLYKIPIIGPTQRYLSKAVTIFASSSEQGTSGVVGDYLIEQGVVMSPNLTVRSDGTKITVKGQANLEHQLTAFTAKAFLEGPLGLATGLSDSDYIEIEGKGSLKSPQLRLKQGGLPEKFISEKVRSILQIPDGWSEALDAEAQQIAKGNKPPIAEVVRSIGTNQAAKIIEKAAENNPQVDKAAEMLRRAREASQGMRGFLNR